MYSSRFIKRREDTPCIGCYEYNKSLSSSLSSSKRTPIYDFENEVEINNFLQSNQTSHQFGGKSSKAQNHGLKSIREHYKTDSYNTPKLVSFQLETPESNDVNFARSRYGRMCSTMSKTDIYGKNDITALAINDLGLKDSNENLKTSIAVKESIKERIVNNQSKSFSTSTNLKSSYSSYSDHLNSKKLLSIHRYYSSKISIHWHDFIDYIIYDIFNHYNKIYILGYSIVFLFLLSILFIQSLIITEGYKRSYKSVVDDLLSYIYYLVYGLLNYIHKSLFFLFDR